MANRTQLVKAFDKWIITELWDELSDIGEVYRQLALLDDAEVDSWVQALDQGYPPGIRYKDQGGFYICISAY